MLQWATFYADHGIKYFPLFGITNGKCRCPKGAECKSPGKHAKVKWSLPQSVMPGALDNMGVSTETLVVIDFDREDPDLSAFAATFTVRTAHGLHLWYAAPSGKRLKSFAGWQHKVDVRASGGMVVAPPSRTVTGGFYEPVSWCEIVALPKWLLAELPVRSEQRGPSGAPLGDLPAATNPIAAGLAGAYVANVASCTENRNENLFLVCCRFFRAAAAGMMGEDFLAQIEIAALGSGLERSEVLRTIESARRTML